MEIRLFTFKGASNFTVTSVTAFALLLCKIDFHKYCPSFQLLIIKSLHFSYNANREVSAHYMRCSYIFLSFL